MSLLDSINKKKSLLKHTETRVTSPCGRITVESGNTVTVLDDRSTGFVVDFKPDLQVAQICPYLFMSSQDPPADLNLIVKYKITRILSLGIDVPKFKDITYYNLPILDVPEFDLISFLDKAFAIIDLALKSKENILVHCNAGVSRSSAIVIGYLMKTNSWTYDQSYRHVKEIRPCIKPNQGFIDSLKRAYSD